MFNISTQSPSSQKSNTKLNYLDDPACLRGQAVIEGVIKEENENCSLILDESNFYPNSGGQKSDQGWISGPKGRLKVHTVRFDAGLLRHTGIIEGNFEPGDAVEQAVDQTTRRLHTRLHSAGELLVVAVRNLGFTNWKVVGAIHYPERSSVDFAPSVPPQDTEELAKILEVEMNRLVETDSAVDIRTVSFEEVARYCGFRPDYICPNQPIRIVTVFGSIGRPCMGTHVSTLNEIGEVKIRKIRNKKGILTISYSLADGQSTETI